jgi:peptidoglycan hydrolase-like protein with peptidoglycan-binding domain
MDSESIKNINNFLHSLTFLPDSKVDSNVFDSETTKAVLKLQQINKAKLTDGIIGPETRSIIEKTAQMIAQKYNLS